MDLNGADLNPLGIIAVIKAFKALHKGLGKFTYLTNVRLNHLPLGSK